MHRWIIISWLIALLVCIVIPIESSNQKLPCSKLRIGQYLCDSPLIDSKTQQPVNCKPNNLTTVNCTLAPGISCEEETENRTFTKEILCHYSSGKSFRIALLYSILFGWLGFDRFYLGYPAIGLFKLLTVGFMLLFYLLDIVLIALQIVGPADGTAYAMDYYGPKTSPVSLNNNTFIKQSYF